MNCEYRVAMQEDIEALVRLTGEYHAFESIASTSAYRAAAIAPLLAPASMQGFIVLAEAYGDPVGYLAVCYGYSIEFGGRDAFVDECYVTESMRGRSVGSGLLALATDEARARAVKALHLEVARINPDAREFYARHGFRERESFCLLSCPL